MADGQVPDQPGVPGTPGDTGVQRAIGERRRRRSAERTGQVDLDATMSHWPVVDPPTTPRPVVRPARPSLEGVATAPVLPTPGAMVVGPLLEARSAAAPRGARRDGARRARREQAGPAGPAQAAGVAGTAGAPAAAAAETTPQGPADELETGPQPRLPADAPTTGERTPGPVAGATTPGTSPARSGAVETPATPAPKPSPAAPRAPRALLAEAQEPARSGLLRRAAGDRRVLLGAAALVVLVVVAVVLALLLRPDADPAQAVEAPEGVPAQQTLALTLADPAGGLVGGALVGVDSAQVSTLLLPADLLLTVADAEQVTLSEAAVLGGDPVRRGLEDTLLLRVDGAVLLTPAQLATLVDSAGGVVVDVSAEVVTGDVLVPAGDDQRLAGAQAVAYAALSVDGEPAEARLARLGAVVQALLAALPAEAGDVGPSLTAAGVAVTEDLGADGLADVVAGAAARASAGNAQQVVLPTEELVAGDASRRGVDDAAARPELDRRFAGALLPVAAVGEVRVLVRNAVGRPGLAAAARDLLVADGLRFAGSANAATFGEQARSVVLVPSQDAEDRDRGEAVAASLGLADDSLQVNSETLVDTDVVVVLGDDFAAALDTQTADPSSTPTGEVP